MSRGFFVGFLLLCSGSSIALASDTRLEGVWSILTYKIEGKTISMNGLFIFTEEHFSANVFFRLSGGNLDDMNANAGTYTTDGDQLVFTQQVQAHIRPGDEEEPIFYGKDVEEVAEYRVEEDELVVTFPSGNQYLCRRIR